MAIRYFDGTLTVRQLNAAAAALAAGLQHRGFAEGDRIVLFLQNDSAFVTGMLAAWKTGGIAVSANPMYKQRELGHLSAIRAHQQSGASTSSTRLQLKPLTGSGADRDYELCQ